MLDASTAASATSPLIVAHRGASADAPENTLAAFRLAFQQNADGIEGDFYLTADGKIVCHHDKDAKRTAGKALNIERATLEQLRELDFGTWKSADFAGEKIPTFEEVLRTVPDGKTFVIELKSGPEIVPVLKAELDRLDHAKIDLMIISFDATTIRSCKDLMPEIKAHWLTGFDREASNGDYEPSAEGVVETLRQCGADGLGFNGNADIDYADFLKALRGGGYDEFHVWTVDRGDSAETFSGLGVYGITTNTPDKIRSVVFPPKP